MNVSFAWSSLPNHSISSNDNKNKRKNNIDNNTNNKQRIDSQKVVSRLIFMKQLVRKSIPILVAVGTSTQQQQQQGQQGGTQFGHVQAAYGACLPGDVSDDCIGVYKVPIDDEILDYINTPEKLTMYAPDIRYVPPIEYPKSINDAIIDLYHSRTMLDTIQTNIFNGNLTKAGKDLLYISPRITVAGRVIIQEESDTTKNSNNNKKKQTNTRKSDTNDNINNNNEDDTNNIDSSSFRIYRVQITHSELVSSLGECDILIGQGIRGDLGSLTAAQILILQMLDECKTNYDTFLKSIPKQ
jgi:hypothetical protein